MDDIVLQPAHISVSKEYKGDLSKFPGRYTGPGRGQVVDLMIKENDSKLMVTKVRSKTVDTLKYLSGSIWKQKSRKYADKQYQFVKSGDRIIELHLDNAYGHYVLRRIRSN